MIAAAIGGARQPKDAIPAIDLRQLSTEGAGPIASAGIPTYQSSRATSVLELFR